MGSSAAEAEPAEGGSFASELCKDSYHIFSTPCYLLTRCGGFIGSASAADLFFCIFVFIVYGIWDDLLCAIGFSPKCCIQPIGRNVISVILVFFILFATWDVLNHPFLVQMAAYGSIWMHTNAYRCIYKLFPLTFIGFHGFSLISAGFEAIWGQKVGRPVAPCGGLWAPVADLSNPFKMMQ